MSTRQLRRTEMKLQKLRRAAEREETTWEEGEERGIPNVSKAPVW